MDNPKIIQGNFNQKTRLPEGTTERIELAPRAGLASQKEPTHHSVVGFEGTMTSQTCLLRQLLSGGDAVSIENGRLNIIHASCNVPPADWLSARSDLLVGEILKALGLDAYRYESYSTGQYGKHKAGGVTIQFVSILHGESAYVVFNADLERLRGKKKGSPLPKGQFRISKRRHFYKFWLRTGLKLPNRLSSFHDYMGNLRDVLFLGQPYNERMDAGSLGPLCVSSERIRQIILPDTIRTTPRHYPDNPPTIYPDNESPQSHTVQWIQQDSAAGLSNYGNTVIRDTCARGALCTPVIPAEQSDEEWLEDYGN